MDLNQIDCCLGFSGFARNTSWEQVNPLFRKFGRVKKLFITPDGFGSVYFSSPEEAKAAVQELNLKPPLNLKVYITNTGGGKKKGNKENHHQSAESLSSNNSSQKNSNMSEKKVDEVVFKTFVNKIGIEFKVLEYKGKPFVLLDDLNNIGVYLSEKDASLKKLDTEFEVACDEREHHQGNEQPKDNQASLRKPYHYYEKNKDNRQKNQYFISKKDQQSNFVENWASEPTELCDGKKNEERWEGSKMKNDRAGPQPPNKRKSDGGTFSTNEDQWDGNKLKNFQYKNDKIDQQQQGKRKNNGGGAWFDANEEGWDDNKSKNYQHKHNKGDQQQYNNRRKSDGGGFDRRKNFDNKNNVQKNQSFNQNRKDDAQRTSPNNKKTVEDNKSSSEAVALDEIPKDACVDLSFSRPVLKVGEKYEIIVSSVEANKFHAYLKTNKNFILQMSVTLLRNRGNATVIDKPTIGQLCCAKYFDEYFRAKVITVSPLKVCYIDFGNESDTEEVYTLDSSLIKIPPQAVLFQWKMGVNVKVGEEDEVTVKIIVQQMDGTYIITKEDSKQEPQCSADSSKSFARITEKIKRHVHKLSESSNDKPTMKSILDVTANAVPFEVIDSIDDNNYIVFCVPPQLIDQLDTIEQLKKVNYESDGSFTPAIGEFVLTTHNVEDKIVRAQLLKKQGGSYELALIDYGTRQESTDVYPMKSELFNIPQFTIVVKACKEVMDKLQDDDGRSCSWKGGANNILLLFSNGDKVEGPAEKWTPLGAAVPTQQIFTGPLQPLALKNDEEARIINVDATELHVQNKLGFTVLKEVNEEMQRFEAPTLPSKPVCNQLVICSCKDRRLRAVVASTNGSEAVVKLVDSGKEIKAPIDSLRNANEKLAALPATIAHVQLDGFTGEKFSATKMEFLEDYIDKRVKCIIKTTSDPAVISLVDKRSNQPLTKLLKDLDAPAVFLDSLPHLEVKMNVIMKYVVLHHELPKMWLLDPTVDNIETIFNEIEDFIKNEVRSVPHRPQKDEVVLVCWDDEWNRASVNKQNSDDTYEVYCLDYGLTCNVSANLIKKLPANLRRHPAMAIPCYWGSLMGKLPNPNLMRKLHDEIIMGQFIVANILSKEGGAYNMDIPDLSNLLR